ncbi:SWI/SNF complex subunit SWI3A [Andrographis paniculata]|uniref:SWI/SNF complex subunit SWI3A n=1 Tax=Andrographis paniculata TaxID=175694 RepID=UPI0021E8FC13|nr:SWI/SNF complex subunit SWI3A [Andrographis paniculata]XP_051147869.1 SWI/SNF complex subunit SWI3A [Andrographis paniculata]XP_051147870.1 SWI/SNF complex subunit SWI3A [Andrographis paniculata]
MEGPSQDLELYTIPSYSSWFSWNNIHEVERFSLREFFDSCSITRSPRIYKEYRDFIISKYREDPSRKLTFTDVRKSLVGDISVLLKVFTFLEKWGLINYNVSGDTGKENGDGGNLRRCEDEEESWRGRVKVEEGAPYGVRVVAAPNSMKPLVAPPPPPPSMAVDGGGVVGEVGESGFKWPPLASYSDIYGELMHQEIKKGLYVCGSCKEECDSAHYEYVKEGSFILCEKCFKSGNYDNEKSADDFNLKENSNHGAAWTEAETLLLLESVLKHGDDWDLVAKSVQTKSKQECISKLIQLPFGDFMLKSAGIKSSYLDDIGDFNSSKPAGIESNESQKQEVTKTKDHEPEKPEEHEHEVKEQSPEFKENGEERNGDAEKEGPPQKRVCTRPSSDTENSLMKQVIRVATMLGPHVAASAADAAVTALCYENQCSREIFDDDDNYNVSKASPKTDDQKRTSEANDSMEEKPSNESDKSIIPLNLRTRAATAAALGAAAASAKLLADQEEREIGHLMSTMIETQLKKLKHKMKFIDDLEAMMEKERAQIEELEESLVADRIDVLQRVFAAGANKSKEQISTKHPMDTAR